MDAIVQAVQVIQDIHEKYKLTGTFKVESKNLLQRSDTCKAYLE